ncbi:hypothetical protein [Bradyrhizobium genosp. P]|uniref:hypothetical protein n=1 Tax=Bradyrhizobium genosp. P TaxID=83641 RepID=UPI003CE7EC07
MQEHKGIQFQDLDQVLHNAHLRRSADMGLWLRKFFEARRERPEEIKLKQVTKSAGNAGPLSSHPLLSLGDFR